MKGWTIFRHAMRLVTGNRQEAMRLAVVPMLGLYAVTWAILRASGFTFMATGGGGVSAFSGSGTLSGGTALLLWFLWMAVTVWVFVGWHRFVLLEEYPEGWIPPLHGPESIGYLGRMLMLAGISLALMIPVFVVVGLAAGGGSAAIAPVLAIVGVMAVGVVFYRLSPILPAAAIGTPLTLRAAWESTNGTAGAIVAIAVIVFVLQLFLQFVTAILFAIFAPLGLLAAFAVTVFMTLLGASLLTSFYGHYVQGRALE
ncbi:hypothetical protein [Roseovarius salinarum]|uniref:hypothetical protein n=1 Tax=Roseovarius salinarum TaxID=1981892 RepID=UPI0012FFDA66|nr:hypothetical protein [Roseovarius salinarum]